MPGAGDDEARHDALGEAPFERIVERSGDAVYSLDPGGRFTYVNEALEALTGYSRAELVGEHLSTVAAADDVEAAESTIRELLADAERRTALHEVDIVTKTDERIPTEVRLSLLIDEGGEFRGSTGVVRDITERWEHEQTLERYETIVEASGEAVYALDVEGRFTFANQAQAEILGYDRDELPGMHFSEVVDDAGVDRGTEIVQSLRESDERRHETFELTLVTGDGRRIPAESHLALLTDEDGRFRGMAGIARDISARKERERALERQNERLDRVASVLSHDLRNPLNVAIGRVQMARDDGEPEHLEVAEEALGRMGDLIDDVLSLARQGQTVVEPDVVGLVSAVESAWGSVDTEEATVEVADPLGSIRADGSRLQRLFENLFRNAIEHAGQACTVQVGLGGDGQGFFVEDDGPGIPPGEREQVFRFGWSTSEAGTGYGLAIAKEIAEAHGWDIVAVEGEDGGARFEVTGVEWEAD